MFFVSVCVLYAVQCAAMGQSNDVIFALSASIFNFQNTIKISYSILIATHIIFDFKQCHCEQNGGQNQTQYRFLEPEGCTIDCILDGQDALHALEQQDYDLILMDIRMSGLNGIETTKAIRGSGQPYANLPIIAITADTAPETNAKCMLAGVDLFLTKPVSSKALYSGIQFAMNLDGEATVQQASG